jgi:hypothetical protein
LVTVVADRLEDLVPVVVDVVAVVVVDPTDARSPVVEPVPELEVAVDDAVVVAGAVTANAVVPPTTPMAAAEAAMARARRVRCHRRRVAVLIRCFSMPRLCAAGVW